MSILLALLQVLGAGVFLLLAPWLVLRVASSFSGHSFTLFACVATTVIPGLIVVAGRQGIISLASMPPLVGYATVGALSLTVLQFVRRPFRLSGLAIAALCFAGLEVLSAVTTNQLTTGSEGLGQAAVMVVGPIVFATVHSSMMTREQRTRLSVITGACICAMSLLAWLAAPASYSVSNTNRAGAGILNDRLIGVANNPNTLGMIATATIIAAVLSKARLRAVLVVGAVVVLLFTGQRAGIVSLLILLAGVLITWAKSATSRALIVAAFVGLSVPVTRGLLTSSEINSDQSYADREAAWRYVFEHISELWLQGWGPTGLLDRTRVAGVGDGLFHAHNEAVTALAVGGLPLFLALGWMLFLGGRTALRNRSTHDRNVVGLLALLPILYFESPLHTGLNPMNVPQVVSVYLLVAALTSVTVGARDETERNSNPAQTAAHSDEGVTGGPTDRERQHQAR